MLANLHLLRPWWLLALIPLLISWIFYRRKSMGASAWNAVCDSELLPFLLETKTKSHQNTGLLLLFVACLMMIIGLSGPSWSRLPVPTFQPIMPRVVILDLSEAMLNKDLTPDRLTRAKYILHDLFNRESLGQIAMVVYTSQPFVVSPLTEDGKTIDAELPMIIPTIMPVGGQNLKPALEEASRLVRQAGFTQGQFLVLTGSAPDKEAVGFARQLAAEGLQTSILPLVENQGLLPLFKPLALAGNGLNLSIDDPTTAMTNWLRSSNKMTYVLAANKDIPLWKDEGLWFVFVALVFLLPVFRRNWLERID